MAQYSVFEAAHISIFIPLRVEKINSGICGSTGFQASHIQPRVLAINVNS